MADPALMGILCEYVGFDERSARVLREVAPKVRPAFAKIVEEFYARATADPLAKAVFKDEAQVERLRVSLMAWLEGLFTGPYDDAYFQKRSRIGRVHLKVGLDQRYMLAAMNVIRVGLHAALRDSAPKRGASNKGHAEIDKICDMELAIMLETYREDYVLKKTVEAEAFAVMGRLTAGLAHEVRNPLNAAALQLDVLRRNADKLQDATTRRKILRRGNLVEDELRRLSTLLDDFLNLARSRQLEASMFDACTLLAEVVELRRPEIESQGIELITNPNPLVCYVNGERDRLKQVVNNLITNAEEALVDSKAPQIEIACRIAEGGRWEVTVRDNGPGVLPEIADRAFESFVTTKEAGTGLGLAIVKRIVELHGGEADLTSTSQDGTRASFWIPVAS